MLHFDTDYMSGAHPKVMGRLMETNFEQTPGYGTDQYTAKAKELILEACGAPDAKVHFLVAVRTGTHFLGFACPRGVAALCSAPL